MVNRMPDAHIPACNTENTDEMGKNIVEVVKEKSKEKKEGIYETKFQMLCHMV